MTKREALLISHREHFTVPEWVELESCIKTIDKFDISRVAAERALITIRDKKLYKPYKNLTEFCVSIFGWSQRHAQRMLKHEEVLAALPDKNDQKGGVLVAHESHSRELVKIPPEKRVEVLHEAKKEGPITAKSIRRAAHADAGGSAGLDTVDSIGRVIPRAALKYWNRKPEARSILGQISAARGQVEKLNPNDPMWAGININGVIADLNAAYNRFKAAIPAYVCPYCQGMKPDNCKCCKGRGTLSEYFWRLVPEEVRKNHERT